MKQIPLKIAGGAAALALSTIVVSHVGHSLKAPSETAKIVKAANVFLATLDDTQRKKELFQFDDKRQRARWSNFPTGFVRRAGLSLAEMTPAQRKAALALVSSALSKKGMEKVEQIMEADEVLKFTDVQGQDPPMFGGDLYYISILGTPSETSPWMLQWGGHHLALNITIAGDKGILTPTLTGAQPALYRDKARLFGPWAERAIRGLRSSILWMTPRRSRQS